MAFRIKTFHTSTGFKSIVLQDNNGPCALIALCNFLVLKSTPMAQFLQAKSEIGEVSSVDLKSKLISMVPLDKLSDNLMKIVECMDTGLEVNPKFNGEFAASPELELFSLFNAPLVHGWVLGQLEVDELQINTNSNSNCEVSYEDYCELQFTKSTDLSKFVNAYPAQLTPSGYLKLLNDMQKLDIAILFHNNHFSTIVYHSGIWSLVSDIGFINEKNIVYEKLKMCDGGGDCGGGFGGDCGGYGGYDGGYGGGSDACGNDYGDSDFYPSGATPVLDTGLALGAGLALGSAINSNSGGGSSGQPLHKVNSRARDQDKSQDQAKKTESEKAPKSIKRTDSVDHKKDNTCCVLM